MSEVTQSDTVGPRPPDGDWLGTPPQVQPVEGPFAICTFGSPASPQRHDARDVFRYRIRGEPGQLR